MTRPCRKCRRWNISEAARAIGAQYIGPDVPLPFVFRVDSREILPGDLFIALEGEKQDGHSFLEESISRRAGVLILDPARAGETLNKALQSNIPVIMAKDTSKALKYLSLKWLEALGPSEIIAITGTVGKTTTREMIRTALSGLKGVSCARKSFNTWIGCALTVVGSPCGTDILVLEFGTNHPGEIQAMAKDYHPGIGVITEVGPGHLEGLGTIEGVLQAKMELADSPSLKSMSYNHDNPLLSQAMTGMRHGVTVLPVGKHSPIYRISRSKFEFIDGSPRLDMVISTPSGERRICSELFGEHNAYAAAFAMAVADTLGVSPEEQLRNLSNFKALPGRGKIFMSRNGFYIIDDTYNANPVSMTGALRSLSNMHYKGRKWAVLGGMGELGSGSDRLHRSLFEMFHNIDGVILIGEPWDKVFRSGAPDNCRLAVMEDLEVLFHEEFRPGDVVLFKGSRSYRIERAIGILEGIS